MAATSATRTTPTILPLDESHQNPALVLIDALTEHDFSSPNFRNGIATILYAENYGDFVKLLKDEEALRFINLLDEVLDGRIPETEQELHNKCFRTLRKLCVQFRTVPTSHVIARGLEKIGELPAATGTFADVWKGNWQVKDNEEKVVAIKILRIYNDEDLKVVQKVLAKEVVVWRRLESEHILKFLGVSTTIAKLGMVSEWIEDGNIMQYVEKNPQKDRAQMLYGAVNGLKFLHMKAIVHGNIKARNVYIRPNGESCIGDFGMTSITADPMSFNASTVGEKQGSARWMAPELVDSESASGQQRPTLQSDVYSLAMTFIEVFSGKVPFPDQRNQQVIFRIIAGRRPHRPQSPGLTDDIWKLIERCWAQEPKNRPDIQVVCEDFSRFVGRQNFEKSKKSGIHDLTKNLGGLPEIPTSRVSREYRHHTPLEMTVERSEGSASGSGSGSRSRPEKASAAKDQTMMNGSHDQHKGGCCIIM